MKDRLHKIRLCREGAEMAEKKDKELADLGSVEEGKGNKIVNLLIGIVVIIIWLGIFALLVKLDVGGFGSNVLRPVLKDVPIINSILPDAPDSQIADENNYSYSSLSDAINRIKELELEVDSLTSTNEANAKYIEQLEAEVERLKVFEENQKEFEKSKLEFDENVVFAKNAPNIEEYAKYYEGIAPDNAAKIYQEVVEQMQYDEKVTAQGKRYAAMDPAKAASVLDVMAAADIDMVCGILESMKEDSAAAILTEMDAAMAAKITKKMLSN